MIRVIGKNNVLVHNLNLYLMLYDGYYILSGFFNLGELFLDFGIILPIMKNLHQKLTQGT